MMNIRKLFMLISMHLCTLAVFAQQDTVPKLPVTARCPAGSSRYPLVLYITGDGGMKKFSADMINTFTRKGYAVVALNALKYFWAKKTPQRAGADLAALLRHYGKQWGHQTFLLAGYSFGADVLPFIYNSLPGELQVRTQQLVLLSPSRFTGMEIHVTDMLGRTSRSGMSVAAAINRIKEKPLLLLFGKDEKEFDMRELSIHQYRRLVLPGGHRYNDDPEMVVSEIIRHRTPG